MTPVDIFEKPFPKSDEKKKENAMSEQAGEQEGGTGPDSEPNDDVVENTERLLEEDQQRAREAAGVEPGEETQEHDTLGDDDDSGEPT